MTPRGGTAYALPLGTVRLGGTSGTLERSRTHPLPAHSGRPTCRQAGSVAAGLWSCRGQAPPAPTGLREVAQGSPRSRAAASFAAVAKRSKTLDGGGARPEASTGPLFT